MEGAFTHVGNHLISDSAAAIKADDISSLDQDDALLYGGAAGPGGSRRATDDNGGPYDDDDLDSLHSPIDPVTGLRVKSPQEEPLPPHACA
jgi:regulator of nonsense transcripts 1